MMLIYGMGFRFVHCRQKYYKYSSFVFDSRGVYFTISKMAVELEFATEPPVLNLTHGIAKMSP
jgi:hypothetical protein